MHGYKDPGWAVQEENQYLAVPLEVARLMPSRLLTLVGYNLPGRCARNIQQNIQPGTILPGIAQCY